jgi:hypothetical protein
MKIRLFLVFIYGILDEKMYYKSEKYRIFHFNKAKRRCIVVFIDKISRFGALIIEKSAI